MDIFDTANGFRLEGIPYRKVCDLSVVEENPDPDKKPMWQQGVQFMVLTDKQASMITYLITNHSLKPLE